MRVFSSLFLKRQAVLVAVRLNPVSRELEDLDALARMGKASPQEQAWPPAFPYRTAGSGSNPVSRWIGCTAALPLGNSSVNRSETARQNASTGESWTAARANDQCAGSQTSNEGLGPRANYHRRFVVDENEINTSVGEHVLREFIL